MRTAFSPSGKSLLLVNDEGRFRLFDTSTGRLNVEFAAQAAEAHTVQQCTCFAWALVGKKARRKELVIYGNGAGQLTAFDVALGEEVWRVEDCHEGGVTGVACTEAGEQGQHVFSVGADTSVCIIDTTSGKLQQRFRAGKHALTCVKATSGCGTADGSRVLAGGSGLAMWDAASQQRLYKYPGHATPVDALAFSPDSQYALSSSRGERHVALWKASGRASKKTKPAAALLSLEQPPVQLATAADQESAGSLFQVLALSAGGTVYVWQCEVADSVQATLRATLQVDQDAADRSTTQQETIHAARFELSTAGEASCNAQTQCSRGAGQAVVIARGSSAKPMVEHVPLPPLAAEPATIKLKPQSAEGLLLQQSQKGKQSAHRVAAPQAPAEAVGADNAGHMVMLKPTLGTHTRKRQAEDNGLDAEAALDTQAQDQLQAAQIDSRVQEGQEEQDGELTLEQRVNALNLHQQPAGQASMEGAGPWAKSTSVTVLLSQALRSKDHQLLEKCFAMSSDRVIKSTVQQLASQDAGRLLHVAVQRLQSSPHRGKQIAAWVRALLLYHTAYLISAPGVQGSLTGLYQAIEARLALYKPLASLQGRLDLVLAQTAPVDPLASHLAAGPLIYHDEDDELPENEVENVLALQGASEADLDSDGSSDQDNSDSDLSSDESEVEE